MKQFTRMAVLRTFPDPFHALLIIQDPAFITEKPIFFRRDRGHVIASGQAATTLQSMVAEELLKLKTESAQSVEMINKVEFSKEGLHLYADYQITAIEQHLRKALEKCWPTDRIAFSIN